MQVKKQKKRITCKVHRRGDTTKKNKGREDLKSEVCRVSGEGHSAAHHPDVLGTMTWSGQTAAQRAERLCSREDQQGERCSEAAAVRVGHDTRSGGEWKPAASIVTPEGGAEPMMASQQANTQGRHLSSPTLSTFAATGDTPSSRANP